HRSLRFLQAPQHSRARFRVLPRNGRARLSYRRVNAAPRLRAITDRQWKEAAIAELFPGKERSALPAQPVLKWARMRAVRSSSQRQVLASASAPVETARDNRN